MIGGIDVARRGRHRKPGHRHPGGRLIREGEHRLSPRVIAAGMPHRRGVRAEDRLDQRAESELGRMCLHGQIGEAQYLAGQAWAQVVGAYRGVIAGPRPLAGMGRGLNCKGEAFCDPCRCRAATETYGRAFESLQVAGHQATKATNHVAVWDRACPQAWLTPLGWGLAALAQHFGLTNRKK